MPAPHALERLAQLQDPTQYPQWTDHRSADVTTLYERLIDIFQRYGFRAGWQDQTLTIQSPKSGRAVTVQPTHGESFRLKTPFHAREDVHVKTYWDMSERAFFAPMSAGDDARPQAEERLLARVLDLLEH